MKTFEQFRYDFIDACREAEACQPEFKRLLASTTKESVIQVIKDNIYWCINNKVISAEILLESFSIEELIEFDIYTSGEHTISLSGTDVKHIVTLGSSQATVKTWGSSQATVETWGSSQATVETWGSSQATVKTWESSQATVETWGSSQAKLDAANGGLIQDRSAMKLYIKKSDYEIVLID